MATLKEMLANLDNNQLEALKQEFIKAQATGGQIAGVETPANKGVLPTNAPLSSRIGSGILTGATAAGNSVVSDVRQMAGFKDPAQEMKEFLMKEQIKQGIDQQDPYKKSQLAINEAILKNIGGGEAGGDLIYRDISTGQEVPQEEALKNIANGVQYIINRRVTSRQGIKEEPVAKPEDLTQEEKQYTITTERVLSSLGALKNDIYPKLDKMKGNKDWEAFQAEKLPFWAIGNQDIEDFKSAIVQLKADIPFLRGGKQLTPTESKRVDILLNPFGKSEETRLKDIKRFQEEFLGGAALMKGGIRELNKRVVAGQTQPTLSGKTSSGVGFTIEQ